jgi:signal transduction histidine kinase
VFPASGLALGSGDGVCAGLSAGVGDGLGTCWTLGDGLGLPCGLGVGCAANTAPAPATATANAITPAQISFIDIYNAQRRKTNEIYSHGVDWLTFFLIALISSEGHLSSFQNASSKRHRRSGTPHRAVEHSLPELLGDPTRLAAHEIRSHLGLLTGYLSLLQEGALGALPEPVGPVLAEMDAKTRAISRLVDDMLEDARFQDGRLHLALQVVDLREIVEKAAGETQAGVSERHRLEVHVPDSPLVAEIDPGRVHTILRNLLDNAVKYSPEGGAVECRLEPGEEMAVVSVADRGIGIDPADADLVFRRFGRARGAAASSITGIGLGLYICRTLARLHGGDVGVKPRPGGGTEFLLTLPLRHKAVVEGPPQEKHSQSSEASRAAN